MAENFIRAKQINQSDLSGFVQNVIDSNEYEITYGGTGININNVAQINLSGVTINLIESIFTITGTGLNIRPTINGTGFLLSGEASSAVISNVVYTTGDQTISGDKTFTGKLIAPTGFFGRNNILSGIWSVIAGGQENRTDTTASNSVIGGGCCNTITGYTSTIGGGSRNSICGNDAVIAGGGVNCTQQATSFIGGGCCNRILGSEQYSMTVGGFNNETRGQLSVIVGGSINCISVGCHSFIGGGNNNSILTYAGTIGGGQSNKIFGSSTDCYSVTVGGFNNRASGNAISILGGLNNVAEGSNTVIVGGTSNCTCYAFTIGSFIGGGLSNRARGCYSVTVGGQSNNAQCDFSIVGGGRENCVLADYGYILGGRCAVVQASHSGAAVFGDGQNRAHNSFGPDSLTLDFTSGVYFSNQKIFGFTPEMVFTNSNFLISGNFNSDVVLASNANRITGTLISGNPTGFNVSIMQVGAGQIQITGSGSNVIVSSYNNQFRTAGQFATISLLHTGNNRYIMYGNTI
jgi:hypothetical protein